MEKVKQKKNISNILLNANWLSLISVQNQSNQMWQM